jgi:hypothetical protein
MNKIDARFITKAQFAPFISRLRLLLLSLLIEKGLITREEFLHTISEERATYQKLLNPARQ